MKLYYTLILFLFSIYASTAQQKRDTIYLWPENVPGENEAKHKAVQTANTEGNVIRLTDITNPTLTVFKPKNAINNGAGVIVCPGGGYHILAIDKEGYEIAEWLNELGYTAFVLEYRVPQKLEGALQDIQRATRIVRSKASTWSLNPNKLGVIGFSAGGDLCARASTRYSIESYPKIDAIDSFSSRPDFSLLLYPGYLDKGENRSLSSGLLVDSNTPPMFIFATADDGISNSALVMTTALRDNKVPVELHLLPEGGHGYGLRSDNVAGKTWPLLAEIWLKNIINK